MGSADHLPPHRVQRAILLGLAAVLALAGCASSSTDEASDSTATSIEGLVREDPLQVGEASLPEVDAEGNQTPFAFRAPDGELLFVAFGYTNCPDVCPTTLSDIRKALADLDPAEAQRVNVAFATVDPARDTPGVMNQYLGSFVDDGHALRTEDPAELDAAEGAFGITSSVVTDADGKTKVSHTARSFVVDDTGDVVVEWAFGTDFRAMTQDLQILLAETGST